MELDKGERLAKHESGYNVTSQTAFTEVERGCASLPLLEPELLRVPTTAATTIATRIMDDKLMMVILFRVFRAASSFACSASSTLP